MAESDPELLALLAQFEADFKPKFKRGDGRHPLFAQWRKMIAVCTDTDHPSYPVFGGAGVTVHRDWFDFEKFKADMESTYEIEPSKPAVLRRNYLARRKSHVGFNRENAYWAPKQVAVSMHARTKLYATPFGRKMTLREIESYLREHQGEDWPDGRTYTQTRKEYDMQTGRLVSVTKEIFDIRPVGLWELRRRASRRKDLFAPVRPYGDDRREEESAMEYEAKLRAKKRRADELGLTLEAYNLTHDEDGRQTVSDAILEYQRQRFTRGI